MPQLPVFSLPARFFANSLLVTAFALPCAAQTTATDGNWAAQAVTLTNTSEAQLMARTGDIDNLGFGWPAGFNPFSGNTTPVHAFPWSVNPADAAGTDRIMVISSYAGGLPAGTFDGYTENTTRPANAVSAVTLTYPAPAFAVLDAFLQVFMDDIQSPRFGSLYTVQLNGQRVPEFEAVLNALDQHGPVGKLVTLQVPARLLPQVASGQLALLIDDFTTGAGDGYAIDFVKLLVNQQNFQQTGSLQGQLVDAWTLQTVGGAAVTVFNQTVTSSAGGAFTRGSLPAGLHAVSVQAPGYLDEVQFVDVLAGGTPTAATLRLTSAAHAASLATAADGTGLTWLPSPGTALWFAQNAVTHDGADALQSGIVPDAAFSECAMRVTGPGTLTWWWRVSSQPTADTLRLYLNGTAQAELISGETAWTQVSKAIPAGPQTISFRYSKDTATAAGMDAAWVDEIHFAPADADADGLPNAWEQQYFGNTAATATADPDNDGQNNLLEWQAGTNPAQAASFFHYETVARQSGGTQLTWSGTPGRVLAARYSTDAVTWTTLPGLLVTTGQSSTALLRPSGTMQAVTFLSDTAPVRVLVPVADPGTLWRGGQESAFAASGGDSAWLSGSQGVGYENDFVPTASNVIYTPYIGVDVKTAMFNLRTSACLRLPFTVADASRVRSLRLNLRVDDGCVVYLNGRPVATHRAPSTPVAWNAAATANTPDPEAAVFRPVDLTTYLHALATGPNMLAIHAMNASTNSSDFLLQARLEGTLETPAPEPARIFWQLLPR